MAIYNQDGVLYNTVIYNGIIEYIKIQNKINLYAYQNSKDNIILYWTMNPYTQFLFSNSSKYELEIDINEDFSSDLYERIIIEPGTENYNNIDNVLGVYLILNIEEHNVLKHAYFENKPLYFRIRLNIYNIEPKVISDYAILKFNLIPYFKFNILTKIYSFLSRNIYKFPILKLSNIKHKYYESDSNLFNLYSSIVDVMDDITSYAHKLTIHPIEHSSKDIINFMASEFKIFINEINEIDQRMILIAFLKSVKKSGTYNSIYEFINNSINVLPLIVKTSEQFNLYFKNDDNIYYFTFNPNTFKKFYINNNRYLMGFDIIIPKNNVEIIGESQGINDIRKLKYRKIINKIEEITKFLIPSHITYRFLEV